MEQRQSHILEIKLCTLLKVSDFRKTEQNQEIKGNPDQQVQPGLFLTKEIETILIKNEDVFLPRKQTLTFSWP